MLEINNPDKPNKFKCQECGIEFEVGESNNTLLYCSVECAVYAGVYSVTKGWLVSEEELNELYNKR